MQRLKHDEARLLDELSRGAAGAGTPSSGRRASLLGKFQRRGWVQSGKITEEGRRISAIYPPPPSEKATVFVPPVAKSAIECEPLGEAETILIDERQIENGSREGEFHRQKWNGMDDRP